MKFFGVVYEVRLEAVDLEAFLVKDRKLCLPGFRCLLRLSGQVLENHPVTKTI